MSDAGRQDLALAYRLLHPPLLLLSTALYGLGAAIAKYLGKSATAQQLLTGLIIVLSIQISAHLLNNFFEQKGDRLQPGRKMPLPDDAGPSNISLRQVFYLAAAALVLGASLTAFLLFNGRLSLLPAIILGAGTLLAFAYSAPPIKLRTTGFGELAVAFLLAAGLPAFSFSLITAELHRLIVMATVPIYGVLFAVQIALSLAHYVERARAGHRDLLVRLGWKQAMRLHDVSLLLGLFTLALALVTGLPRQVAWGSFLITPLALFQIWYLNRIRAGAPFRWRLLTYNSYAMVGLMAYLELVGFLLS
jgi:1,4-dihydroxy-2-naphthoate octaprenyltransferase